MLYVLRKIWQPKRHPIFLDTPKNWSKYGAEFYFKKGEQETILKKQWKTQPEDIWHENGLVKILVPRYPINNKSFTLQFQFCYSFIHSHALL
jgi:hypothetical protein